MISSKKFVNRFRRYHLFCSMGSLNPQIAMQSITNTTETDSSATPVTCTHLFTDT